MIPKAIIEKAIEGGWDDSDHAFGTDGVANTEFCLRVGDWWYDYRTIMTDRAFWQALGKALGWGVCGQKGCGNSWGHEDVPESEKTYWKKSAHRFYDLILTGGDTGKFWNDLLQ